MMGHLDVVPADAGEWRVPPFSGVVKDGFVWGVGATDMKNQVAAEAVALARLKRSGAPFAGTVKFAATADEEDGEFCGVQWLCEHRPDALRADYLLNEGMGGLWLPVDGRKVFLLAVGEKAFAQFLVRTRGRGGHGSVPEKERSAVIDLARAVTALGLADPPAIVSGTTARFIDVLVPDAPLAARLKDPATARAAGAELRRLDPVVAGLIEPLFGATLTPTILTAGKAVNVIPTRAEAQIDCRILPEMTHGDVETYVASVLDPLGIEWEFEWVDVTTPNASPPATAVQGQHRAGPAPGRPRRRPRAHDVGELHRLALGARGVPRLRGVRLRSVPRGELPRHGRRPRPRARRADPRRGRDLPGALLRAARQGPPGVNPVVDPGVARDRYRGALLGLATGEALGAPAEFLTAEQVVEKYGVITEMIGGGVYDVAPGEITDATQMMLCLAESLADNGEFEPEDIMARYGAWLEGQPLHVSLTVRAALISYRSGTHWDVASRRAFEILGGPTAGNGSLIRCTPVGLLYGGDAAVRHEISLRESTLTHFDRLAGWSCAAFNDLISAALHGELTHDIPAIAHTFDLEDKRVSAVLRDTPAAEAEEIISSSFVLDTLQTALWTVLHGADFEHSVTIAVNMGNDATAAGATTGALAGAVYGESGIPDRWLSQLTVRDRITAVADKLAALAGATG